MSYKLVGVGLFLLCGCNQANIGVVGKKQVSTVAENPGEQAPALTVREANRFLDSIRPLNPAKWVEAAELMPDSVFRSQQSMDVKLSSAEWKVIRSQAEDGKLDLRLFNRFALKEKLREEQMTDGSVWVRIHPFKNPDQFALELYSPGWESDVYFFDRNHVVAKHHVYHRYGLEIESFTAESETVIYYKQNFTSGAGAWWFNFNFFRYSGGQLIPVLDLLENSNLAHPNDYRMLYFESFVTSTNPLAFKMIYLTELSQPEGYETDTIQRDSTVVQYSWNAGKHTYEPNFRNSKLDQNKILSFYLQENELLYVHSHHALLKSLIHGKHEGKKNAVLRYLAEVRKNAAQLDEINDWIR